MSVLNKEDKPGKEISFPEFNKGNFQSVQSLTTKHCHEDTKRFSSFTAGLKELLTINAHHGLMHLPTAFHSLDPFEVPFFLQ